MSVIIFRHAQSEWNIHEHLIGWSQPHLHLTDKWKRQAETLGLRLKWEIDEGFIRTPNSISSPDAFRHRETAEIVCDILQIPLGNIIPDNRLAEQCQWDWEWKVRADIYTPEVCDVINLTKGTHRAPNGGESQVDVSDRMEKWINWLTEKETHWGFSSSLAISALIQRLVWGYPWRAFLHSVGNASITEVTKKPLWWWILRFGDWSHTLRIK